MREIGQFIDGTAVRGGGTTPFDTIDPATGETLAAVTPAIAADVDRAVAAAARAQQEWQAMDGAARAEVLNRIADALSDRRMELAELEVADTGKPISEAPEADIDSAVDCFRFFAGVARSIRGESIDLPGSLVYTRREPWGVCAGIGAWNYPIQIASWKAAPALACGNAMVFKPSEVTPLTAMELAGIIHEAGVPKGLYNLVNGAGDVGAMLSTHPGIAKVSVTGSVATGKRVMAGAADTLKAVTMELGGKSPLIVFADANLDDAVSAAMLANFYTQGEICTNGTRVFVHRSIRDAFLEQLVRRTEAMIVGDPKDPATHVGAMISAAHLDKVMDYVAKGKAAGATVLTGGERLTGGLFDRGAFMRPTIFADVSDDMLIARDEIFGPVMSVFDFDDEDEVVARANATEFGLAAGLMTRDLSRAHRVAAALQAGTVWVNTYNLTPIEMPFGGVKQSGLGRENGHAAVDFYTRSKSVYVGLGPVEAPY
ncbi:MAG: betaine-aldehyde dehydrogenase [Minwuia sp.]|nr:betaine-aldehyde dehydrogenase [Minwuia sp.]